MAHLQQLRQRQQLNSFYWFRVFVSDIFGGKIQQKLCGKLTKKVVARKTGTRSRASRAVPHQYFHWLGVTSGQSQTSDSQRLLAGTRPSALANLVSTDQSREATTPTPWPTRYRYYPLVLDPHHHQTDQSVGARLSSSTFCTRNGSQSRTLSPCSRGQVGSEGTH